VEILSREGYRVLEAGDGVEAMEVFNQCHGKIHLLLTDIVMPRMRGTDLVEDLTRRRPDIAIVYLSGYTEQVISNAHGFRRVKILEKPYTGEMLLRTVRQALDDAQIAA
jgi:two-component system cell cycle sensor histidine kinase/response regulator CckA